MSHGITATDTMFSVSQTPWHGLGAVLDAPPSIKDALALAGLDWTVRLEPIHTWIPSVDGGQWLYEEAKAPGACVVRNDTNTILGTVGAGWRPVQNVDALAWFQPWVDTGKVVLETAGSLFGGRRVWVLARIVSDPIEVTPGDEVRKYILLGHAHDGTLAIRAGHTAIRVVCNNTLGMAVSDGAGSGGLIKIAHRANAGDRLVEAREAIEAIDARMTAQGEAYRTLAAADVQGGDETLVEFLGAVYRQTPDEVKKGRRLAGFMESLDRAPGQAEARSGSWWWAYNGLTYEVTHRAGRSAERRADGLVFGQGADVLRRGIDVALAMATRTYSIADVAGEFSDIASTADISHPNADVVEPPVFARRPTLTLADLVG